MIKAALITAISTAALLANPIYNKCVGCHGANGEKAALGKSAALQGQSKEDIKSKLMGYKNGTLNVAGMGGLMKGQVANMSEEDIDSVSEYISTLK